MAGKKRKRSRPDAQGCLKQIEQVHSRAKEKALRLLIRTLQTRAEEAEDLVQSLKSSLGLEDTSRLDEDADVEDHKREESDVREDAQEQQQDTRSDTSDQHNEVCEVCEKGGKLLCCDTCSLVFHLACVRPKLDKLPRGKWSCAYCIADSIAKGDKEAAKRAVATMKALSTRKTKKNGIVASTTAVDADNLDTVDGQTTVPDTSVVIVRSGRRYILKEKLATIGKYDTLDQAIMAYREHTGQLPSGTAHDNGDELWCSYCLDDPSIEVCAFCGCRKCFGKHDTENLLLCDGCDSEYHIYCLEPPLSTIPGGKWFCTPCLNRESESDSERSMEFDEHSADQSESVDDATRESFASSLRGDESRENTDSMNGFSNGDMSESRMSYPGIPHADGGDSSRGAGVVDCSDSEMSSSHTGGEMKRVKFPPDIPTITTSYDLAAVVQLSSQMSERLLDEDELAQLSSVCAAAIPDHLHTLLDALHQQKHLILKKLDKEESLARKKAAGKDGSAASSGEDTDQDDDSSPPSSSDGPSSGKRDQGADDETSMQGSDGKDGEASSPRVSRKRQPRSSQHAVEDAKPSAEARSSTSSIDKVPNGVRQGKQARKSERSSSRRQSTAKAETKDLKSAKSAAAATTSRTTLTAADPSRALHSVDASQTKKSAKGSGHDKPAASVSSGKNSTNRRTSIQGSVASGVGAADAAAPSVDALRGHPLPSTKLDSLQGLPHLPPLSLSQLASGLTTEQMLQLMSSDMLLNQHQFHGLGNLGFGNGFMDYARNHAIVAAGMSGLPNLPLHDFAGSVGGESNGVTLTQVLRELNQRQLTGKPIRPVQDDLLVATLAAALTGTSNSHYHTSDMYSSLAQANMRWLQETQTPRSTSTEASTTEPKRNESSKLSRKYPVKQK